MVGNVTFSGLGSGLPPDIVDQIMASEKTRVDSLQRNVSFFQTQKSVYSELKTKLSAFGSTAYGLKTASSWTPRTASSGDESSVAVTAGSTAQAGAYDVSVYRLATKSTQILDGSVSDTSATVTSGASNLSYTYNGQNYSVAINNGDTLRDIAGRINGVDYGSDDGVNATVINDGNGARLVMTAADAGAYQRTLDGNTTEARLHSLSFSANVSWSSGDTSSNFSQLRSGQDAKLAVNGVNVFSDSNTVSEAVQGLTFELKAPTGYTPSSVDSSTPDVVSATRTGSPVPGNYSVSVDQLPTKQTVYSNVGVSDENATVTNIRQGIHFDYNGQYYSVDIATGDTLQDLASRISGLNYGDQAGVTGSVVNDGGVFKLALTARDDGAFTTDASGNTVTERISNFFITNGNNGNLSWSSGETMTGFATESSGTVAKLTVDGEPHISLSNSTTDAIPGVRLDLRSLSSSPVTIYVGQDSASTVPVTVGNDTSATKEKLQEFIASYNEVVDYVNAKKEDELAGESAARNILLRLKSEINTATTGASGDFNSLAEIGVRTNWQTGHLEIHDETLDRALEQDFTALSQIFTASGGNQGLAVRMDETITLLTRSGDSVLAGKANGLDARIEMYQGRVERENQRLEQYRERLVRQFANLDALSNAMNQQGAALSSAMAGL